MDKVVRAIDVGHGNTKYVTGVLDGRVQVGFFPSRAVLAPGRELAEALGRRRRTVELEVDGEPYEVGPEVHLAEATFTARNMDDDFALTAEYLALARGALYYMDVPRIDLLVVGLPVSTMTSRRAALAQRLTGTHRLGPGRKVDVERVKVLAQPHGALAAYGLVPGRYSTLRSERSLIIDCGARTFDWLVAEGLKPLEQQTGAVNRGMFDVLQKIAERIGKAEAEAYTDLEEIDRALRTATAPRVFGREHNIEPYLPAARKVAEEAVTELRRSVQSASHIHNILVAGGGAFFFRARVQEAFRRHRIIELQDGMFANVRGFQLAGIEAMHQETVRRARAGRRAETAG